jgi:2,3-dihydroxybiphenyl 1,2-dioxygenase
VWATELEAQERRVGRLLRVSDPSGIVNEVYCRLQPSASPFSPSRDLGGFVTGDLGMGHIVLCVDDYEASLRFYREDLGLAISDYIDVDFGPAGVRSVAFLPAGARHHALALVPISTPKRLHHVMVQVTSLTDVGTTFDRCQDAGVGIALSLGQHTNDRMTSFYMQSPSGFQIEYGHGGIEIDDDWKVAHHDAPSLWGHRPQRPQAPE